MRQVPVKPTTIMVCKGFQSLTNGSKTKESSSKLLRDALTFRGLTEFQALGSV